MSSILVRWLSLCVYVCVCVIPSGTCSIHNPVIELCEHEFCATAGAHIMHDGKV